MVLGSAVRVAVAGPRSSDSGAQRAALSAGSVDGVVEIVRPLAVDVAGWQTCSSGVVIFGSRRGALLRN